MFLWPRRNTEFVRVNLCVIILVVILIRIYSWRVRLLEGLQIALISEKVYKVGCSYLQLVMKLSKTMIFVFFPILPRIYSVRCCPVPRLRG